MAANTPLIQFENVDYRQQGVEILRDVSWRLNRGQHWAVLGPNGSGKTTLLRIACGYLWPSAGQVLRMGRRLIDLREMRRRVGWVSGDLAAKIPPDDSALETVVTGRTAEVGRKHLPTGGPTAEDYQDAAQMLRDLRCSSLAEKRFGVLSQGERQQVMYARARMVDPVLIVLDEPCAGMDPGVRERFLAWLDEQAAMKDGPAIVLVTHHVDEIVPSIERTLIMAEGRIFTNGLTADVVTRDALESVYQHPIAQLIESSGRRWPIWGDVR